MTLNSYTQQKKDDLIIQNKNLTIEELVKQYPNAVEKIQSDNSSNEEEIFLVKKTIFIDKEAVLDIISSKLLLESSSMKDNDPVRIIIYGKTDIINSTVISWDPDRKRPDFNPYHPRSFLVAKDGGEMNVIDSTINYLGFSQAGIHTLFSSLAALSYYNTSNFVIANSTISYNLYGFYSDETSNFTVVGNEIFGNIGYGLDPHTGSKDFVMDSNHLFSNGGQGIICSLRCKNVTITNNVVEYNAEGIGLHWLTNSSTIENNLIKYNKGYGLFIKNSSYDNIITNNTIIGNGYGIGLFEQSNHNIIRSNSLIGNILSKDQIDMDEGSQLNLIEHNNIEQK
jgi:parallel beta-helix repeat protein